MSAGIWHLRTALPAVVILSTGLGGVFTSSIASPKHETSAITSRRVIHRPVPAEAVIGTSPDPKPDVPPVVKVRAPALAEPPEPSDTHERPEDNKPDVKPIPTPAVGRSIVGAFKGPEIEGYARYEGQAICDPTDKAGTVKLRNLLLSRYPSTRSSGVSRNCDVGGRSEHKEGRAFDWGANAANAGQRAAVESFFTTLFATDAHGNKHALARRMGIMYVIWNQRIWHAQKVGWQPYSGTSPHTDHAHISLSWAGARAQTSFWSGHVVPGLPDTQWDGRDRKRPAPETPDVPHTPRPTTTPTPSPQYSPDPTPPPDHDECSDHEHQQHHRWWDDDDDETPDPLPPSPCPSPTPVSSPTPTPTPPAEEN